MPLRISAGPSKDKLCVVRVNDETQPLEFESPIFAGRILVRIRNFDGVTPDGSQPIHNTDYFNGVSRKFSIQVEGRFKKPLSGNELFYGNDFDEPVTIPRGATVAMRIAQFIDPAVFYDIQNEKPWIMSPVLCSMNVIDAWLPPQKTQGLLATNVGDTADESSRISAILGPWNPRINDIPSHIVSTSNGDVPINNYYYKPAQWRRQHFLDVSRRDSFVFSPECVYGFEFYAPFMDFNTFHLKMGLSFDVAKHLGNQPVRYTCRTKPQSGEGSQDVFVIQFELVDK